MKVPKCCCGKRAQVFTSLTYANPGRRFFGCAKHGRGQGCNFFQWIDPRICERSRTVIPGLLRKVKKHEELQRKVATIGRVMRVILLGSWVTILVFLLVLFSEGSRKHVPNKNVRLELEF